MDAQQIFITLQKNVFDYCDKVTDLEFIVIVDSFVFHNEVDTKTKKDILDKFLVKFEVKESFENHLLDLANQPYFLKVSGSSLNFLENLKRALLVCSYNKFRNEKL